MNEQTRSNIKLNTQSLRLLESLLPREDTEENLRAMILTSVARRLIFETNVKDEEAQSQAIGLVWKLIRTTCPFIFSPGLLDSMIKVPDYTVLRAGIFDVDEVVPRDHSCENKS